MHTTRRHQTRKTRRPFGGGAPGGVFDGSPVLLPSRDANPRKPTIFPPQPVRTSVIRRAAITNRRNLRKIERRRIQSETLKFNETAKFSIWKTTKKRANLQVSYMSTVRKLYLNASILLGFLRFLMAARRIMDVLSGKIVNCGFSRSDSLPGVASVSYTHLTLPTKA